MRSANPSAMAVFPTPGSPMSTGLFLDRRDKTCIARRISSSRPMTGSSFPSRASWVRSRAYFFSASYPSSAFSLSALRPWRSSAIAASSAFAVTPASFRTRSAGSLLRPAMANSKRSVVTKLSPAFFAPASASANSFAPACSSRNCAPLPDTFGSLLSAVSTPWATSSGRPPLARIRFAAIWPCSSNRDCSKCAGVSV